MLSDSQLRELIEFKSSSPVLSVYLNTEPSEGNADAYRLRLRNLLRSVNLPEDAGVVERYFNLEYNWKGRGVAVFSCAAQSFFRAYPLMLAVRPQVQAGERFSVKPLAALMDNYGGYGVVLVDKQGARLFHFHLGEMQEQEGVLGEQVKHTKRGGSSSVAGMRGGSAGQTRFEDETVERNLKEVAAAAAHFFEHNHVRRVLIGGTDENVHMFRSLLPKAWQSLVVGSFHMPMTATHAEVLARTLEVGREAEMQRELRLAESLLTSAAKEKVAVAGLQDTLSAVNNDRVKTLVMMEHLQHKGGICKECNHLTSGNVDQCESCGGKVEPVNDVIDITVNEVMRHGGDVEVLHPVAAFEKAGGIGAFLRY